MNLAITTIGRADRLLPSQPGKTETKFWRETGAGTGSRVITRDGELSRTNSVALGLDDK